MRLRLLLPSVALVVIATMVPAGLRHPSLHFIAMSFDPTDFVNNILLYMPLGLALGGTSFLRASGCGFALATFAECLQIGYVDRIPSPLDVLSNTMGAAAGYLLAKVIQRFDHDPTSLPVPRPLAVISLVVGLLGAVGLIYRAPVANFSNWEPEAYLSIGPWNGSLSQVQVYPFTMTEAQVQGLRCAGASQPAGGLLPTTDQRSIYNALTQENRLTLVACLKSPDAGAPHMARLITYAKDRERNFSLVQAGDTLLFLLRTPASGRNGRASAAHSGPVLEPDKELLAAATYDGRISRLFINGQLAGQADLSERRPHLPGRLLAWLPQPLPIREIELGAAEAFLAGLLAVGILGTFGVPRSPALRAFTGVAAGALVGGIVWVFGVSAPRLGMRILLESIAAGVTLAISAIG